MNVLWLMNNSLFPKSVFILVHLWSKSVPILQISVTKIHPILAYLLPSPF